VSSATRPLDTVAIAAMVVLCLSWGLNQVAIKLAVVDIPPLMQAAIRSLGALAIVGVWAKARGIALLERDGTLGPGLLVGVLFGIEFIFIYCGMTLTLASRAIVFLYTAPFFVALGARWLGERLNVLQWCGLALSFMGIAVAMGVPQPSVDAKVIIGDAMLIAAGAFWAATTLVIKGTRLSVVSPEKALVWQIGISAPIFILGAWLLGEQLFAMPRPAALGWLAYQTVWVVGITYPVWFALVKRYSASRLSAFSFLAPLFGVALGYLLIGEPVTPIFAVAVAMVVAGLLLVNRPRVR
jgi:drug/metabolite transporter (DMT)-like permease